jgi:hypothetical protein
VDSFLQHDVRIGRMSREARDLSQRPLQRGGRGRGSIKRKVMQTWKQISILLIPKILCAVDMRTTHFRSTHNASFGCAMSSRQTGPA